MKGILKNKENIYWLLFCLTFFNFLLYSFYALLSLVVSNISILSIVLVIINLFCSIYFIVSYQLESNKIIEKVKKSKKRNYKKQVVVTAKKKEYSKSNSLKNKLINIFN